MTQVCNCVVIIHYVHHLISDRATTREDNAVVLGRVPRLDEIAEDSFMDIVICSDDLFLDVVVEKMGLYDEVAPYLGLSKQEVDNIRRDHPDSEKVRKLEVLREWKKQKGSGATCKSLIKAFLRMKDKETADCIVSYVKFDSITRHQQPHPNDVMPDRALQQYPNWGDLQNEEKQQKRKELIAQSIKIQRCYSLCIHKLSSHYSENPPPLNPIKAALISYIKGSAKTALPELKASTTIGQIFLIIAEHSSWFNYAILELVVEVINSEIGTSIFSSYLKDTLKPYLERSIYLVPHKSMSTYSTTYSPYVPCALAVDDDELKDLTAKETKRINETLAELLHIHSLQLMSYECGSLRLIFGIYREMFEYEFQQNDSPLHKYIEKNEQENAYYLVMDINL